MNVLRISKRMAATGIATALAAGALVGAGSTAATAATASNDYNCTVPGLGSFVFPLTVDVPNLDAVDSLPAGFVVPESLLNLGGPQAVNLVIGVPATLAPTLAGAGVTALSSPDFAMGFGNEAVPLAQLALGTIDAGDGGTLLMNASGTNGAFSVPEAGTWAITMPAAFTMVPTVGGIGDLPIACTTDSPATLKSITATKSSTATTAKAPKPIKRTARAVVKTAVAGQYVVPTGKVVAMEGKKKVGTGTLSGGKANLKLAKLKHGVHTIVVKYVGDGYNASSAAPAFKLKVK